MALTSKKYNPKNLIIYKSNHPNMVSSVTIVKKLEIFHWIKNFYGSEFSAPHKIFNFAHHIAHLIK